MLTSTSLKQILTEHPFLHGLDEQYIALLASFARLDVAQPGQYLFRTGDVADCCYLIRHGQVAIEVHHPVKGPIAIQTVGPDKVIGWSWLAPPYRWSFDGRAVSLTRGVCIDGPRLRKAFEADHELGYHILRRFTPIIVERLEAARLQLLDLYGPLTENG